MTSQSAPPIQGTASIRLSVVHCFQDEDLLAKGPLELVDTNELKLKLRCSQDATASDELDVK